MPFQWIFDICNRVKKKVNMGFFGGPLCSWGPKAIAYLCLMVKSAPEHLYYCTGWLLTASRQSVNQCIGEYGSFIIKCIGLLQLIWPEIIGHLPHN